MPITMNAAASIGRGLVSCMCNPAVLDFIRQFRYLAHESRVLEVGSLNINGSARTVLAPFARDYLGVDIASGPGVDELVDAVELESYFGPETFDLVVSTEMLEHCDDWPTAIQAMKSVLTPLGHILLTTRSPGFVYHSPPDYWRFTQSDMQQIFLEFDILTLEPDPSPGQPGIFLAARKPLPWTPIALDAIGVTHVSH